MKHVRSPALDSIGYDKEKKELYVRFTESGLYKYKNVPEKIYDELMAHRHHGAYYDEEIKNKFPGEKIE